MSRMSRKLKIAIKLADRPAYLIAADAKVSSSTLSRLMRGIDKVKPSDPRVIAVGKVLGIPAAECFEGGAPS